MFTTFTACASCGGRVARKLTGRQKLFCSATCRNRARRERNLDQFGHTRTADARNSKTATGALKNGQAVHTARTHETPPKSSIKSATFETENRGRAPRICGPRPVLEIEIFAGRDWRESISADGVTSQLSMLRPPVVRGGAS